MKKIHLLPLVSNFAENKDVAKEIRLNEIMPSLERGEEVTLDFEGIDGVTQSFVHALISDVIRKHGNDVLDRIYFKSCNETVRKIINIVVEYMHEAG